MTDDFIPVVVLHCPVCKEDLILRKADGDTMAFVITCGTCGSVLERSERWFKPGKSSSVPSVRERF